MTSLQFHHSSISRLGAEELLLDDGRDGSFLVRDSETVPGAHTLCLLYKSQVHQYRILPDDTGQLSVQAEIGVQQRKFVDLIQLMHEYQQRGEKNGLVAPLRNPMPVTHVQEQVEEDRDSDDHDEEDGEGKTRKPHQFIEMFGEKSDYSQQDTVSMHFLQRYAQLDLSVQDGVFINQLRQYLENGLPADQKSAASSDQKLSHLTKLLTDLSADLQKELNLFMSKVTLLGQLFSGTPEKKSTNNKEDDSTGLNNLLEKLVICKAEVLQLEKNAVESLKDIATSESSDYSEPYTDLSCVPLRSKPSLNIPSVVFEVKTYKFGKPAGKITLTVDVQAGKLFAVKPTKDILNEQNVFTHNKILQLIKNTKNNRLDLIIQGHKKYQYVFEDVIERENFCQLVQQLKDLHSTQQHLDHISVFIGTWNMGDEMPTCHYGSWLKSEGTGKSRSSALATVPHDMYVIGTQESSQTEKDWVNKIKACLMEMLSMDMHVLCVVGLWGIRLAILINSNYRHKISHLQHSSVRTGIANKLGNKGAVGVSFNFDGTSFCFISAHLTSGAERNNRRNQNYHDIIKGMSLGNKKLNNVTDLTNQFHHVFFFGDLNYRLFDVDPLETISKIKDKKFYRELLMQDQLKMTKSSQEAFFGFNEEDITFPPTYRFIKGTKYDYSWQKFKKTGTRINVPSWCDRILWKSFPETYIVNTSYGCIENITISDHKPVFSSFNIGIMGQYVSSKGCISSGNIHIIFHSLNAEIRTSTKEYFKVEFHSGCLEGPVVTGHNQTFAASRNGYCSPCWNSSKLPQLQPIIDEEQYLEDQHILLVVKSADEQESYGECVVALKSMMALKPQCFDCHLTHRGEVTGKLRGEMHVKAKEKYISQNRRARKSYELIYTDTDEPESDSRSLGTAKREGSGHLYSQSMKIKGSRENLCEEVTSPQRWSDLSWQKSLSMPSSQGPSSPDTPPSLPPRCYNDIYSSPVEHSDDGEETSDSAKPTVSLHSHVPLRSTNVVKKDRTASRKGMIDLGKREARPEPKLPPRQHNVPRMPRLGQSSLTQSSVLPVVSITTSNSRLPPRVNTNNNTPREAAPPPLDHNSNPASRDHTSLVDNTLYDPLEEDTHALPTPLEPKKSKSTGPILNVYRRQKSVPTAEELNIYNGHRPITKPIAYDTLRKPATITEWLLDLGLPLHISAFFQHGWDQMEFVKDITEDDLIQMDITNPEHSTRIMRSIRDMSR